jgi:ribosomal protein S18 acetylase RimI-like enzyme
MKTENIKIREAVAADATLVGRVVLMALHYDDTHPLAPIFAELAAREVSQYSYRNALVAEVDGSVVGAIIGYDGARLEELRKPLFELMREKFGNVPTVEDETSAGEFYIDSFAVLPQYRGCGVGHSLLSAARDKAFASGYERVGLLVDFTNPRAEKLYASLGFERVNATTFLGCDMWHMQARRHS